MQLSIFFEGSQGVHRWHCVTLSFFVTPNQDFYVLFGAYQASQRGNGTFAIDEIRMTERDCSATCML